MRHIGQHSLLARRRRRGAVVLELLIALPLLVIGTMAAVEMGLWMTGRERVEMAARLGAEQAATRTDFAEVQRKVKESLAAANVPTSDVQILLIHNVGGPSGGFTRETNAEDAPWGEFAVPPALASEYVRVVVRVPSDALAPNLLKSFGFDLSQQWTVRAKTFRFEGS